MVASVAKSETQVFLGITTYFIVLTFLLGLSPYSNGANFIIATNDVIGTNNTASGGFSTAFKVSSGILCGGSIAIATTVGILTGGIGFIGFAAVGTSCGAFVLSLTAPSSVADSINVLAHNVFVFLAVFFELLTFQLAIPLIMNIILVVPPGGALMYQGVRVLRGGG